jgi:hypothetical protein
MNTFYNNKSSYNNYFKLTEKRISDIYPKNYNKIIESLKFNKKIIEWRKTFHSLNFKDLNIHPNK